MTKGKPMIPGIDRAKKQEVPVKRGYQPEGSGADHHKIQKPGPSPVRTPPKKP